LLKAIPDLEDRPCAFASSVDSLSLRWSRG
jgi:hypothetical protein